MVALKNNMIYDLALAPNVEVEFSTGKRWSLNTEYKMSLVVEQSERLLLSASFGRCGSTLLAGQQKSV